MVQINQIGGKPEDHKVIKDETKLRIKKKHLLL
jgi:hypothetical protein